MLNHFLPKLLKHEKTLQIYSVLTLSRKKRFQKIHLRTGCSIQATAIATTVTMKASLICSVSLIFSEAFDYTNCQSNLFESEFRKHESAH